MKVQFLDRQEERNLIMRWQSYGDERAANKLITAHIPLAHKLARQMKGYGLPHEDMVQEAILGMYDALNKFDVEKGVRFSTLVFWYARAAMQEYILRNFSIVKSGTTAKSKAAFFRGDRQVHFSLDVPAGKSGEGDTKADILVDHNPLPDEIAERVIDAERLKERIERSMKGLPPRSADIIKRRYLVDDGETQTSIGEDYEISHERIRQIEVKALNHIRAGLVSEKA